VVLMDVQMPELDGLAATRRIRELAGPASLVPIVALSANAMTRDRDACFEAGMTDYLAKPIDVAALHRALARARAGVPDAPLRLSTAGICSRPGGRAPARYRPDPGRARYWTGRGNAP